MQPLKIRYSALDEQELHPLCIDALQRKFKMLTGKDKERMPEVKKTFYKDFDGDCYLLEVEYPKEWNISK